jgi:CRISPR-associated endonuclease/helicase Cas3
LKWMFAMPPLSSNNVFSELFPAGRKPFAWQESLFSQLVGGDAPESLSLPTATGKTYGLLRCWLGALCEKPAIMPRRLAYVVNRRAVIDQVYEDALSLAEKVKEPALAAHIAKSVPGAHADSPLGVYAFRGQRSLDHEWLSYPERPAILIGTVDMLGSRLLFRAYVGSGDWRRAQSAGLLGQDTWFVLDEPHLAHPFRNLLASIKAMQNRKQTPRPFWFTQIGATNRGSVAGEEQLRDKLTSDKALTPRLSAHKKVTVCNDPLASDAFVAESLRIASGALKTGKPLSVAVIVSTVRLARALTEAFTAEKESLGQVPAIFCITGAMRGVDRDALLASQDFRDAFAASGKTRKTSALLIGTHCLEAGFDGDFDLLISDIASAPSVLQRLGRLNRVGEATEAEGHFLLIQDKKGEPLHVAAAPTHKWMLQLGRGGGKQVELSGSYATDCGKSILTAWDNLAAEDKDALSDPTVAHPFFEEIDAMLFSMSSSLPLGSQGRTDLYLHGFEVPERSETSFVWREEAQWLAGDDLAEALRCRRPLPAELAQLSPYAAREELTTMMRRLAKHKRFDLIDQIAFLDPWDGTTKPAFLRRRDGSIRIPEIGELANRVVVIPPDAGGYAEGFVDGSSSDRVEDVAAQAREESVALSAWCWDGSKLREASVASACKAPPDDTSVVKIVPAGLRPPPAVLPLFAKTGWLVLGPRRCKKAKSSEATALKDHLDQVKAAAKRIARSLDVPSHLETVVVEAAAHHDVGKSHHGFQRFLGNADLANPVAKSAKPVGGRSPFRHEALSVLVASVSDEITRHVIGTHHGYGRPVFDPTVRVPHAGSDQLTAADGEWLQNFGQLSAEFNPWVLAWLESLVRAADAQASAEPAIVEEEAP